MPSPQWRRLRGYAFDPGMSLQFDMARINEIVFRVPWERLERGPIGEYLEVLDHDPASGRFYLPVDLDDPRLIAADGEDPDESNPRFHQQFVYAVAMTTIHNFEKALGRRVLWSRRDETRERGDWDVFVKRLRIYPHAFRAANAYYSPAKKALLFGYFPASDDAHGAQLPGGLVFTCLSHDIVAHETTHALLDATQPRFINPSNADMLAFHEAFADIVALFQHFSFPEVLRDQIARTRGDLTSQSLLGQLAQQFGQATGAHGGLREAIGKENSETGKWERLKPDPKEYATELEPHARGALLVAAIFDAFLTIYRSRVSDLIRLATGGSGELPTGELPPDLTNRLTREAAKTAQHVLTMCIRALDYCPPVDLTFGDYLRAIITADTDLMPDDDRSYRVAFIEAFRSRGIYPRGLTMLTERTLRWPAGDGLDPKASDAIDFISGHMRESTNQIQYLSEREKIFEFWKNFQRDMHELIAHKAQGPQLGNLEELVGLIFRPDSEMPGIHRREGRPSFSIESVRPARRRGAQGEEVNQVIMTITQRRDLHTGDETFVFPGGCTLIFDLTSRKLRYAIAKPIIDEKRVQTFLEWLSLNPTAATLAQEKEPIAYLHLST